MVTRIFLDLNIRRVSGIFSPLALIFLMSIFPGCSKKTPPAEPPRAAENQPPVYHAPKDFNWKTYVENYDDLRLGGIDTEQKAIQHWIADGQREGRTYRKFFRPAPKNTTVPADFDWRAYIENYEDIQDAGIDNREGAIKHWLWRGQQEGRTYRRINRPSFRREDLPPDFSWRTYVENYGDLKALGIDTEGEAERHWVLRGQQEGRTYRPLAKPILRKEQLPHDFDWRTYVENYADLKALGIDTEAEAAEHWQWLGAKEGRSYYRLARQMPKKDEVPFDFDWRTYVENYPDLRDVGVDTKQEAEEHWQWLGAKEGRTYQKRVPIVLEKGKIPLDFDWKTYINNYPDLKAVGIDTEVKAKEHWQWRGFKEGRVCNRPLMNNAPGEFSQAEKDAAVENVSNEYADMKKHLMEAWLTYWETRERIREHEDDLGGGMAERSNAAVLKTVRRASVS